jgi:predicted TIM-barrel fold metal-dependent hydrolase
MAGLQDESRAKILGLNAARLFGLDPAAYAAAAQA